jgi:hypothetical protein
MKRILALLALFMGFIIRLEAQSPIGAISTTYVSTSSSVTAYSATPASGSNTFNSCSSGNFSYTFNNGSSNAMKLLSLITNSKNYFVTSSTPAIIKIRRVNNASVTGNRTILCLEATNASTSACPSNNTISLKSPYVDLMENVLNTNFINQGTDNVFTNTSNNDGNVNNIERIDVVFMSGFYADIPADAGFAIFDRGANFGHDGFRIAAIKAIDASGNPTLFGPVKTAVSGNGSNTNGSWGHPTTANGNTTMAQYVLRKDAADPRLRVSTALNQQIGGVFFTLADLGIAAGENIHGYAIIPPDGMANPTTANLLDLTNTAVYPTTTVESPGGLDLMAVTAVFATAGTVLSVKEHLTGSVAGGQSVLNWSLSDAASSAKVELERGRDQASFQTVYSMPSGSITKGSFREKHDGGTYFYRLKIKPLTGQTYYSNTIVLRSSGKLQAKVYPAIASSDQQIMVEGLKDNFYHVSLVSTDGREQFSRVNVRNGKGALNLQGLNPGRGLFILKFFKEGSEDYYSRVIIE